MKKILANTLAIIFLFILFLVAVTLKKTNSNIKTTGSNEFQSSFTGPTSSPSGVKGPTTSPPSFNE